ncbi:MAG: M28 family peptidase [Ignavibacteriales bacterium]|nr:M28 family peptidase [Ignavibacteriales bacterium]
MPQFYRKYSIAYLAILILSFTLQAQRNTELRFASLVDERRLQQTVVDLVAMGNRMAGTRSGQQSATYLVRTFKSFGLRVDTLREPSRPTFEALNWELKIVAPRRLSGLIQHDWLGGFSPSLRRTTARIVAPQDLAGIEKSLVKDAVVLVKGQATKEMYDRIVGAGGVAIMAHTVVQSSAYSGWAMLQSLPESKSNPIPLYLISNSAATRLRTEIERGNSIRIRFAARTKISTGRPISVLATIPGKSDEYVIVCAHGDSDSGGPGADDNASGVAGVVELSRVLHHLLAKAEIDTPSVGIKFIVWGREYSSAENYVRRNAHELKHLRAVINYDEIGTGRTRNCLYFEGNDISINEKILRTFNDMAEEYVGKRGFWKEATTNPSQDGTDSYVFLPKYLRRLDVAGIEIPSVTVFTAAWNEPKTVSQTTGWSSKAWKGHPDSVTIDYSMYYHSSLDIPNLTTSKEPFNMAWAVKAVGIVLLRLAW